MAFAVATSTTSTRKLDASLSNFVDGMSCCLDNEIKVVINGSGDNGTNNRFFNSLLPCNNVMNNNSLLNESDDSSFDASNSGLNSKNSNNSNETATSPG